MGVDLAVYRARIGRFVPQPVKGVVSNMDYLCKAIVSVRSCLIPDGWNTKGAVTFIDLLLRAQGIEPNPGPGRKGQWADEQTEDNDDVNITLERNDDTSSGDWISQLRDSIQPTSDHTVTDSSQTIECTGAVAIPGPSSGTIARATGVAQCKVLRCEKLTVNVFDRREYREEIYVKNMKVKHAENVCTGDQTIIHAGPSPGNEDDDIPKPKKEKKEDTVKKSGKRIALEENAETMLKRHIEETANVLVTRTEAITAAVKRLKDYNMVVIVGVTGEGKTTLGREICKQLRDGTLDKDIKRKTPVIMTVPQDWSDVVNDKDDIVVFVDDIFGKRSYQTGLLDGWKSFFDRILHCLQERNVCLVVTSRTHILKDARRESGVLIDMISEHILDEKKTVDLTGDQKLTSEERLAMYENYCNQRHAEPGGATSQFIPYLAVRGFPSNISIGYAQICKLFFANDAFYEKGECFFENPDRLLIEEIENMRLNEPHKYFALVYCFINNKNKQTVDSKMLNPRNISTEYYDNLKLYAEECGIHHTDNVLTLLKNGLDALDRTYLTRRNTVFMFGHQSIADSVSLVIRKYSPEMIDE